MVKSATVEFYAVLENEHYYISVSAKSKIIHIFEYLKSHYEETYPILDRISYKRCKFYKLKDPVLVPDEDFVDKADMIKQCLDEQNWTEVSPDRHLKVLGSELRDDHIYLVVKPPRPKKETDKAIEDVLEKDEELFCHCSKAAIMDQARH
ncbi:hypothetical protein BDR07DRAFT_1387444 [Suillus spraguei]|nr:hypothetical protein BDR07DRAFT_1387444 [Suillus spraguei]